MQGRWKAIAADLDYILWTYSRTRCACHGRRRCATSCAAFSTAPRSGVLEGAEAVHKRVLRGRVFVALHMHAGDGNVHTNIPVNSDDYAMLQRAYEAVARIMRLARALGGVISGEHGIGIMKLEFLDSAELGGISRL